MSECLLGAKQSCGVTVFQQMVHYSARWQLLQHMLVFMPPSANYCCHKKSLRHKLLVLPLLIQWRLAEHAVIQHWLADRYDEKWIKYWDKNTYKKNGKQNWGLLKGRYTMIIDNSFRGVKVFRFYVDFQIQFSESSLLIVKAVSLIRSGLGILEASINSVCDYVHYTPMFQCSIKEK